jgi:hypothetical protein
MNNVIVYAAGIITGMFIAQRYNVPDVKRLGTKIVKEGVAKLKEWEKKDSPRSPKDKK